MVIFFEVVKMKILEKKDLLKLIYFSSIRKFDFRDFLSLLQRFGDDYYLLDGRWVKIEENQARKEYIAEKEKGEE